MSIMVVAGTRPELIKLEPVMQWLDRFNVDFIFVWSGQHYDYEMSRIFYEQLGLREADVNLDVKSGTHAEQTAKIMLGLEKIIDEKKPRIVVAQGDTNTVLASAIVSSKLSVPFAHVEAGLRSWNLNMPEEINRRVADTIASLHFAPTEFAALNLAFEGVPAERIRITGNTIVDVIVRYEKRADEMAQELLNYYNLSPGGYALLTIHRAENVDCKERLANILKAVAEISKKMPIIFPMHPRTRKRVTQYELGKYLDKVLSLSPLGYFEFLGLLKNARVVLTDSGGVQEEAFSLKVPTVTLRYNTERPETTLYGVNVLAGADFERIVAATIEQAERYEELKKLNFENCLGDGNAGKRISEHLKRWVDNCTKIDEPDLRSTPFILYRLSDEPKGEIIAYFTPDGTAKLTHKPPTWRILVRLRSREADIHYK